MNGRFGINILCGGGGFTENELINNSEGPWKLDENSVRHTIMNNNCT